MSDFKSGMLVQHSSLGLGKVVALESDSVHVFFETSATRFATKLRLSFARPLLTASPTKNAWLKGMAPFTLDPKTGRYGLAQTWLRQDEAIARFTRTYPRGFSDPKYLGGDKDKGERAAKWRAAHEAYAKLLGNGEGERLLAEGNVEEIVRRTLRIERQVLQLQSASDRTSLREALGDSATARDYFAALFAFLAAPRLEGSLFDALASAAAGLPKSGSAGFGWELCTLFPFIAQPDRHMLLRPKAACEAANRFGFNLSYEERPCWSTYSALLRWVDMIQGSLQPIGARDNIDVECFMHVVAIRRASA